MYSVYHRVKIRWHKTDLFQPEKSKSPIRNAFEQQADQHGSDHHNTKRLLPAHLAFNDNQLVAEYGGEFEIEA